MHFLIHKYWVLNCENFDKIQSVQTILIDWGIFDCCQFKFISLYVRPRRKSPGPVHETVDWDQEIEVSSTQLLRILHRRDCPLIQWTGSSRKHHSSYPHEDLHFVFSSATSRFCPSSQWKVTFLNMTFTLPKILPFKIGLDFKEFFDKFNNFNYQWFFWPLTAKPRVFLFSTGIDDTISKITTTFPHTIYIDKIKRCVYIAQNDSGVWSYTVWID